MRTVQATETAVSIWFSHEDVPGKGQLVKLVRQALTEAGLPPWGAVEAECFTAGEEMLVIARPGRKRYQAFYFDDLEALLGGALSTADGESSLYKVDEGYVLTVERRATGPGLFEYGQSWETDDAWEQHAKEQGQCLMEGRALADLRRYFLR